MTALRRSAAVAVLALGALVAAGVGWVHGARRPAVVLAYWDGAAADEPGYAEEAANQLGDGAQSPRVGFFERPGYWNNRAIADDGEAEMDARMFRDAADRENWETAGTDFDDVRSLFIDSDADNGMMGAEYGNSWPGTGEAMYDYANMAAEPDGYDGQWPMQPLDLEAVDDAGVSQSGLGGFKAVGPARFQTLAECEACDAGADCVAGCRVGRQRATAGQGDTARVAAAGKRDDTMSHLDVVLRPKRRFSVDAAVERLIKENGVEQGGGTGALAEAPGASPAPRRALPDLKRLSRMIRQQKARMLQTPAAAPDDGSATARMGRVATGAKLPGLNVDSWGVGAAEKPGSPGGEEGAEAAAAIESRASHLAPVDKASDSQSLVENFQSLFGDAAVPAHAAARKRKRTHRGGGEQEVALSAADAALTAASMQLRDDEARQRQRVARARQLGITRGKRLVESLEQKQPLAAAQADAMRKPVGSGAGQLAERRQGRNLRSEGYWPLGAGAEYLRHRGITVDASPLDEPEMPEQKVDTRSLGGWWASMTSSGHKLKSLGVNMDPFVAVESHPHKLSELGVRV